MRPSRYYLIDHKVLFLIGYFFYLFTPLLVGIWGSFRDYPGMNLYHGLFALIPRNKLATYLEISLLWLPAFLLGNLCFKLIRPGKRPLEIFPSTATSQSLPYVAIFLLVILVVFAYLGRNSILGGYGSYDVSARGKISTLLVIFNFFMIYQLVTDQRKSYLLFLGTLVTALLLLSMGGRMYVLQTFIVFLVYKTSFARRRWNIIQILGFAIIGFLVGSAFGIWRLGASFNLERAAYSFVAEPVFTWFSTSSYLVSNEVPLFNLPLNFLTSFLNLIPNTVISLKPLIVSTHDMVKDYQSPLGADSVWSNIVINFGSIGSFFFIFATGFFLNFLKSLSESSRFWAVYYIMVCGMLPFQFFRDGFYILDKQLLFNFFLFPASIFFVWRIVLCLHHSYQKAASPPDAYAAK